MLEQPAEEVVALEERECGSGKERGRPGERTCTWEFETCSIYRRRRVPIMDTKLMKCCYIFLKFDRRPRDTKPMQSCYIHIGILATDSIPHLRFLYVVISRPISLSSLLFTTRMFLYEVFCKDERRTFKCINVYEGNVIHKCIIYI